MFKTIHNLHYEQIGKEVRCIEDELPFEIPDSWEWARLNSVGSMARGNGIKRNEVVENGYPCIRYGEIYTSYNLFFKDSISHVGNNIYDSSKKIKRNDLVYTLTGENKPDIAKTVAYLGEKDIAAGGDLAVWSNHQMNPLYLSYLLSSPYMISNKVKLATGDIIVHISVDKVGSFIAPIPPLEEQNRIVKQILILEELIKEYSEKEEELYKLNSNIKEQLKKSILQYAIEGKLVPQNPNDEPASILLERIHKEKNKLIAEGKIKKDKNESIIYRRDNSYYEKLGDIETCINDKLPYDLPASWSWCNVGNLFTNSTGLSYKKDQLNKKSNSMVRVLRGGNILEGNYILNSDDVFISSEFVNDNLYLKKGYMITPAVTSLEHIGKIALIDKDYDNIVVGGFVLMLKPVFKCHILIEYLLLFFSTNYYREECRKITHKSGQAFYNLSRDKLMKLYIAIPPLNEQKQIVDKYYQISRLFVL